LHDSPVTHAPSPGVTGHVTDPLLEPPLLLDPPPLPLEPPPPLPLEPPPLLLPEPPLLLPEEPPPVVFPPHAYPASPREERRKTKEAERSKGRIMGAGLV
jgi:hypothetical protein